MVIPDFFMRVSFFTLINFLNFASSAQVREYNFFRNLFGKTTYDSNYVTSYYNDLHITGVSILHNQQVEIFDYVTRKRINFKPNNTFTFGFGLDWKFLTIELSRSFNAISPVDESKGETNGFNLRVGLTGKKFLASSLLQVYQGMYISNPQNVYPNWDINNDKYPTRPDITSVVLFASLYYNFNATKFSTMAALWQLDKQLKSNGGMLTGITFNANTVATDSILTTGKFGLAIDPSNQIQTTSSSLIGINIGYGYTQLWRKNYFISSLFMPGLNIQSAYYKNVTEEEIISPIKLGVHGDFRLIVGYNGPEYYAGIHYANYFIQNRISELIEINLFNSYLRFFIGKRFAFVNKRKAL